MLLENGRIVAHIYRCVCVWNHSIPKQRIAALVAILYNASTAVTKAYRATRNERTKKKHNLSKKKKLSQICSVHRKWSFVQLKHEYSRYMLFSGFFFFGFVIVLCLVWNQLRSYKNNCKANSRCGDFWQYRLNNAYVLSNDARPNETRRQFVDAQLHMANTPRDFLRSMNLLTLSAIGAVVCNSAVIEHSQKLSHWLKVKLTFSSN